MKGKHYNTTTLSHPLSHTKKLSYIHTIKYLLFFFENLDSHFKKHLLILEFQHKYIIGSKDNVEGCWHGH
jgi:hypothetical protein